MYIQSKLIESIHFKILLRIYVAKLTMNYEQIDIDCGTNNSFLLRKFQLSKAAANKTKAVAN